MLEYYKLVKDCLKYTYKINLTYILLNFLHLSLKYKMVTKFVALTAFNGKIGYGKMSENSGLFPIIQDLWGFGWVNLSYLGDNQGLLEARITIVCYLTEGAQICNNKKPA